MDGVSLNKEGGGGGNVWSWSKCCQSLAVQGYDLWN